MEVNLLSNQRIFHYNKLELVDENAVNGQPDSIVIIAENADKKHEQIRVLPFNTFNQDKYSVSFTDKVQYFKKELRNLKGGSTVNVIPHNTAIVTDHISDFFTHEDGLDDEFASFVDGFTNKPPSGFGGNIDGFFGDIFVDISEEALVELEEGLGTN